MKYFATPEIGLSYADVNNAVEAAFAEHGRGNIQMPPKVYITFPHGDFRTMPAYLPALNIAGVKVVNVHPLNPAKGLPTVMALTVILDVDTGRAIALLNATKLTNMRTGAAGAVACKYLSPKKNVVLGLVGSGQQAESQVRAIAEVLSIEKILVWSRTEKNTLAFCKQLSHFDCESATLAGACDCDVLVTTTPSRAPLVKDEWVHEGTHINAIGADAKGKQELDPAILNRAMVIVDDPVQAAHSGEINVPISNGQFRTEDIAGTLGEVVLGKKKRSGPDQVTVFDSTGLAIQDLAIAEIAMKSGRAFNLPYP
jgi:alanine dehydrogenase